MLWARLFAQVLGYRVGQYHMNVRHDEWRNRIFQRMGELFDFRWLDPPPGGWMGRGFSAELAGASLTEEEMASLFSVSRQGLADIYTDAGRALEKKHPRFGLR